MPDVSAKKPQKPRVLGTYKKPDGRYEVRYINPAGKQCSRYRNQKRDADALARQIATTITSELADKNADSLNDNAGWYKLLQKIALCATEAGEYQAAVSASKAAVIFMPPPPEKEDKDLTKQDKAELLRGLIEALEAEGYEVKKKKKAG